MTLAAEHLRGLLPAGAFLVFAIDEAAALKPHAWMVNLLDSMHPDACAEQLTRIAVRGVNVLRTCFVLSARTSPGPMERTWLALMDTNSALGTMAPRPDETSSARIVSRQLTLCCPYFAFPINMKLSQERRMALMYSMTPLESSTRSSLWSRACT